MDTLAITIYGKSRIGLSFESIGREEINVIEETPLQAMGYASFDHNFPNWVRSKLRGIGPNLKIKISR